jgi:hypothetical protein
MIIGLCGKANAGKDTAGDYLMSEHAFKRTAFAQKLKQFCGHVFGLTLDQMSVFLLKEAPLPADHVLPFDTIRQMSARAATAWADVFDMPFDEWSPLGSLHHKPMERYPFKSPEQVLVDLSTKLVMVFETKASGAGMEFAQFILSLSPRQIMQWVGTEVGRSVYQDIWVETTIGRIQRWVNEGHSVVVTDMRFQNEAAALLKIDAALVRVVREDVETTKEAGHASEADLDRLPYKFTLRNFPATEEQSLQKFWRNVAALMETVEGLQQDRARLRQVALAGRALPNP